MTSGGSADMTNLVARGRSADMTKVGGSADMTKVRGSADMTSSWIC